MYILSKFMHQNLDFETNAQINRFVCDFIKENFE